MENKNNSINKRISSYRKLAGFTQAEVAEALGMKRNTYARMEKYGNPSPDMLKKLSKVLRVSIAMLVLGDDNIEMNSTESPQLLSFSEGRTGDNVMPLSFAEENFIKIFRTLTKEQQENVSNYLINQFRNSNK